MSEWVNSKTFEFKYYIIFLSNISWQRYHTSIYSVSKIAPALQNTTKEQGFQVLDLIIGLVVVYWTWDFNGIFLQLERPSFVVKRPYAQVAKSSNQTFLCMCVYLSMTSMAACHITMAIVWLQCFFVSINSTQYAYTYQFKWNKHKKIIKWLNILWWSW